MSQYHIYGIGAALVDTEIAVNDAELKAFGIDKGVMTLVDESRQHELIEKLSDHLIASKRASGGSAANTIIAASYFGADTFYSCKVADDENGKFYIKDMQSANVAMPNIVASSGITGKCLVMITPDAERTMNTFLGISETISNNELDHNAIKNSAYVYIEGYLVSSETGRAAAIECRQIAEANNVKTALSLSDPAMVQFFHDGLSEMIGTKVDLLFCNLDEALTYTKAQTVDVAIAALKAIADEFVITMGNKGALIYDGSSIIEIAPCETEAIDSNGAGDMFAGAFLYALTQGHSHTLAGNLASLAASTVVSQFGPRLRPEQHQTILESINR